MSKTMLLKKYISGIKALLILALLAAAGSCSDDDLGFNGESPSEDVISFDANIIPNDLTRANQYIEEGTIDNGTYYLLYQRLTSSSNYNRALVDFGADEGPTTGFAYFYDANQARKDLKWRSVYGQGSSTVTFYLSNIDTALYTTYHDNHWNHFRFNVKNVTNPYVTGPLDKVYGTNDMLLGSGTGRSSTGKININMNHILSLLKVNIEVYGAKTDGHLVDLSNAEVTISNVATTVGAFQLTDPTNFKYSTSTSTTANTGYGTYRDIKTVTLFSPDDPEIEWESVEPGTVGEDYRDDYNKMVYSTKEFVMPPQTLPPTTGYTRPMLSVKVPKKDVTGVATMEGFVTYSGYIPDVMFHKSPDGNGYLPSPETLALKSGCQLTITASINSPETELTFAPIVIEAWISKGSYTITTKQAGIYNVTDFNNMVTLYKQGVIEELERYGYQTENGSYSIQFWGNLNLDREKITDCMKYINGVERDDVKFNFVFNGHTITVKDGDDEEELYGGEGQQSLYTIVTGHPLNDYKGIHNEEDFMTAFGLCGAAEPDMTEIAKYGFFNNTDNTYSFDIRESLTLDIEDLLMKIPPKIFGYDIIYSIPKDKEVKVNLPEPGVYISCKKDDAIDRLAKLTENATTGFGTHEDLMFLVDLYNNYYKYYNDILKPYGAQNTAKTQWTFYILNVTDLVLNGDEMCLTMIPDDVDKPKFTISTRNGNTWVDINSAYMKVGTRGSNSSLVYRALSGVSTTSNLSSTASYYSSKDYVYMWTSCGYFQNEIWHFPFATTCKTVAYGNIWNKMVPDFENGKYEYEFTWTGEFTVTGVPVSEGSEETETLTLIWPEDEPILKSITNGTYWEAGKNIRNRKNSKRR